MMTDIQKTTVRLLSVAVLLATMSVSVVADVIVFGEKELHGRIRSKDRELTNVELLEGGLVSVFNKYIDTEHREDMFAWLIKRGDYYLQKGDRDRAWTEYQSALTLAPNNPTVRERLNQVIELERIERCKQALERNGQLLNERKYREAIDILEVQLDTAPEQLRRDMTKQLAETYATAAYYCYDHTDMEGARAHLAQAERLDPDSPMFHFVQGRMLHDDRDWEKARAHYIKAIKGNPGLPRVRNYLEQVEEELLNSG